MIVLLQRGGGFGSKRNGKFEKSKMPPLKCYVDGLYGQLACSGCTGGFEISEIPPEKPENGVLKKAAVQSRIVRKIPYLCLVEAWLR